MKTRIKYELCPTTADIPGEGKVSLTDLEENEIYKITRMLGRELMLDWWKSLCQTYQQAFFHNQPEIEKVLIREYRADPSQFKDMLKAIRANARLFGYQPKNMPVEPEEPEDKEPEAIITFH